MSEVGRNLTEIRSRIAEACSRCGRDIESVELIAVSKTFPVEAITEALKEGQLIFGESKFQEAKPKIEALSEKISWHFIGRLQRNKIRKILPMFDVVHAVDSQKLLHYMDEVAKDLRCSPKIFLQVNQGDEETKGGFQAAEVREVIQVAERLKNVEVIGLMSIPPPSETPEGSRKWFSSLRKLRDEIEDQYGTCLPALSMGMSNDFEIAIEEEATHVRVGSSIFGKRGGTIQD